VAGSFRLDGWALIITASGEDAERDAPGWVPVDRQKTSASVAAATTFVIGPRGWELGEGFLGKTGRSNRPIS